MIKNIILDLGNVVVEFKPKDYLHRLGFSDKESQKMVKIIWGDPRWNEFDRGSFLIDEYKETLISENPEFASQINAIFAAGWERQMFVEKREVTSFVKEISDRYNIFILSNVSELVLRYIKTFDFFKVVSGGSYSYELHSCKPEVEIYENLFLSLDLKPEECLFLDDKEENIHMGERLGMTGIVFHDNLPEVEQFLSSN